MTINDFVTQWNGKPVPSAGGITGQCVSLVQAWANENGVSGAPVFPVPAAKDIPHSRDDAFDWTGNTPSNSPQPGDIVVFGDGYGAGYGHTGVCVSANANYMQLFEENDPDGSPAHVKNYDYWDCLGWYRIKGYNQPTNQGGEPMTSIGDVSALYKSILRREPYDWTDKKWIDQGAAAYVGQPWDKVFYALVTSPEYAQVDKQLKANSATPTKLKPGVYEVD